MSFMRSAFQVEMLELSSAIIYIHSMATFVTRWRPGLHSLEFCWSRCYFDWSVTCMQYMTHREWRFRDKSTYHKNICIFRRRHRLVSMGRRTTRWQREISHSWKTSLRYHPVGWKPERNCIRYLGCRRRRRKSRQAPRPELAHASSSSPTTLPHLHEFIPRCPYLGWMRLRCLSRGLQK